MLILVNPPNPPGKVSNKDMMGGLGQLYEEGAPKIPPIDIPYTAACLKQKNIPVEVIDCLGLDYDSDALILSLKKKLVDNEKISIALRTSLPTYCHDMEVARNIKQQTNAQLVFFGPQVSLYPKETIEKNFIDVVIIGEPEFIFVDIFLKGLKETRGIWFKDESGQIIRNAAGRKIEDLNQLPIPLWELMPYKQYILPEPQFPNIKSFLPILTSRGCPFNCGYCPYPLIQGCKWRTRSVEKVIEELKYIVNNLGITNVLFRDPEFTLDKKRTAKLCQEIIREKLVFFWRCETRIDTLDEELIEKMAEAGCRGLNLGVESISPKTLKRMGRSSFNQQHSETIIDCCRKKGINTFCFFIIGLPGEDKKDILKTIKFAQKLDPSQVQFTFAIPYPQTPLRKWAQDNNFIEDEDLNHYTGYIPVMRNEHLTVKQLKRIHNFANKWVGLRKSQKKQRIRKFGFIQAVKELLKEVLFWFKQWFV
ncbi:MAG: radical SAM protein [Omnitrophica bacterium]|nr:radical SAM protein [Candidatus Omnitrophota bacterium]